MRNPILPRFFKLCLILLPLLFATIYVQQSDAYDVLASGKAYIPHIHSADSELLFSTRLPDPLYNGTVLATPLLAQESQVGRWSKPIQLPIVVVHMMMMPDGQILVWDRENHQTHSMQFYNLTRGVVARSANPPASVFCSGHIMLPDGRMMLAGGHFENDYNGIADTYVYDPVYGSWVQSGDMTESRWYPTLTQLPDGQIIALGGTSGGIGPECARLSGPASQLPEIFSLGSNTWTSLSGVTRDVGLYPRTFLMPTGNRVFVTAANGVSAILDVGARSWQTNINGNAPDSGNSYPSAAMYRPGKILYTAGNSTSTIDLKNSQLQWGSAMNMAFSRYDHNLVVLADGNVLAVGGSSDGSDRDASGVLMAEMWYPNTGKWEQLVPMLVPRMYHSTAFLLPDASVYVAGGGRACTLTYALTNQFTSQIYYPPYLFKGARPIIGSLSSSRIARGNLLAITTSNAASISSVALIGLPSTTHAMNNTQSYIPLTFTRSGNRLVAQIPSNTTNEILPGTYMLFIVNNKGVPSVAKFVTVVQ